MFETIGFIIVFGFLLGQFLLARTKVFPLILLCHGVFQYIYTLMSWHYNLLSGIGVFIQLFIFATSLMLIWIRKMGLGSQEQEVAKNGLKISQWILIGIVALFTVWASPDWYEISMSHHGLSTASYVGIHPFIRFSGNFFLFGLFAISILKWGLTWTRKEVWVNLGPFLLYIALISYLLVRQAQFHHQPYA